MTVRTHWWRYACVIALLTPLILLGAVEPVAHAVDTTAPQRFAACLSATGSADIVLLLDESGSLAGYGNVPGTDPDGTRIVAAKYFLTRMAGIAESSQATIRVLISGFSVEYDPGSGWVTLDTSGLPKAIDEVATFADKNHGAGTDYWLGLNGARNDLNAQRKKDPQACQAIVFFSDGQLDIQKDPRESASNPVARPYVKTDPNKTGDWAGATKAAQTALCSPTGLATQIRVRDIIVFGIGLSPDQKTGTFDLMKNVVTGSGNCGEATTPPPGYFVTAKDIDDLLFAFNDVTGAKTEEKDVCQGKIADCKAADTHLLAIDGAVSQLDILGNANIDGVQAWLVSPSGEQLELKRGTIGKKQNLALPDTNGRYTWLSEHTLELQMSMGSDASAWLGEWQLIFVDPVAASQGQKSRVSVNITGDLRATIVSPELTSIRQGSLVELEIGMLNRDKKPVHAYSLEGTLNLDISVTDANGTSTPVASAITVDQLNTPVSLDVMKMAPGSGKVVLTVNYTTAGSGGSHGTSLAPSTTEVPFIVLPPANFPTVVNEIDLGAITGPVDVTTQLSVQGPGCVWLDPASPNVDGAPDEVGQVSVQSINVDQSSCVAVANEASGSLPIRVTTQDGGNGDLLGTFIVKTIPLDAPDVAPIDVIVHYSGELTRPLNQTNFTIALIAALILGVGIPVGLAYLAKYLLNSKMPNQPLYVVEQTVTAGSGELLDAGSPLAVDYAMLSGLTYGTKGGDRARQVGSYRLVSKMGWSPFGGASVIVDNVTAGATSYHAKAGTSARLPLAVANTWTLVKRPGMADDEAGLLLLIASTVGQKQVNDLLADLNTKGPAIIADLTAILNQAPKPSKAGKGKSENIMAPPPSKPDYFTTSEPSSQRPTDDNPFK
ncbi:MAG: VWA domain-containing protein [Propionibacteriaceae bacterium]|nr:VWA domain-containing protein [Propionibacteriaceae bacterium]